MKPAGRIAGLGLVLLAGYGAFLYHHTVFSAGGADSSGYLNAARLLRQGQVLQPVEGLQQLGLPPEFDRLFIPLGFIPGRNAGTMAPSYPPGLPLHMAIAGVIAGESVGPFFVSPLAAIAWLVLIFLLAREMGLPHSWALAGAAILAAFPTFVFQAVQPMSDVLAGAWACGAVLFALRARRQVTLALAAGFFFGVGVLVRPTNALLLVPLSFALPVSRRAAFFFLGGAASPAFALVAYNRLAFGNPFASGYGSIFREMSLTHVPSRLVHYIGWLSKLLTPLLLAGWVASVFDRKIAPRDRAMLVSWFLSFLLFYCFYFPYETWWYTRFLLPAVPPLILGALLAARNLRFLEVLSPAARRVVLGFAVLFVIAIEVRFIAEHRVHKFYKGERLYPEVCRFVDTRLPAESLLITMQLSGALEYYTSRPYVMWNWLFPDQHGPRLIEAARSRELGWYAVLAPFEVPEAQARLPGRWEQVSVIKDDVTVWRVDPVASPASR